jgi:hypothetical protein
LRQYIRPEFLPPEYGGASPFKLGEHEQETKFLERTQRLPTTPEHNSLLSRARSLSRSPSEKIARMVRKLSHHEEKEQSQSQSPTQPHSPHPSQQQQHPGENHSPTHSPRHHFAWRRKSDANSTPVPKFSSVDPIPNIDLNAPTELDVHNDHAHSANMMDADASEQTTATTTTGQTRESNHVQPLALPPSTSTPQEFLHHQISNPEVPRTAGGLVHDADYHAKELDSALGITQSEQLSTLSSTAMSVSVPASPATTANPVPTSTTHNINNNNANGQEEEEEEEVQYPLTRPVTGVVMLVPTPKKQKKSEPPAPIPKIVSQPSVRNKFIGSKSRSKVATAPQAVELPHSLEPEEVEVPEEPTRLEVKEWIVERVTDQVIYRFVTESGFATDCGSVL